MSDTYQLIISVAILLATFSAVFYVYINMIRLKNTYNEERKMIEINSLREHLEAKISKLNNRMTTDVDGFKDMNHLVIAPENNNVDYTKRQKKAELSNFLRSFGINEDDMVINPNSVFVLTPFHKDMRATYDIIKGVCYASNLTCSRGDEELVSGEILPHIVKKIVNSRIIIANISGRNPNVFYELGIAHALDKPTILISKSLSEVPFDLQSKSIILYDNEAELTNMLQSALIKVIVNSQE
ncbi:hypothetical protein [Brevibacillus choshinensis]|uniref:Uncharacterized protein n=1 Tax=Brevibacillus choshinensis TaxID=54911 RepID=A0ABX7FS46_BRECH|nr:hypothetical protein [Brevibacillus choshinensis]QRG68555.1 hypothetical protein JNE38_05215 [Brevibacillus choshinensis]